MKPSPEEALLALARRKPPAERATFLERDCGEDAGLRRRAGELLAVHESSDPFLETRTQSVRPAQTSGPLLKPNQAERDSHACSAQLWQPTLRRLRDPTPITWALLGSLLLPMMTVAVHAASTVQFTAASFTVAENAGAVALTVQRTNDIDTLVSVDYACADDTATNGLKYTAVSGTLAFGAGETNKDIVVPILNEGFVEGTRTFQVILSNPTGVAVLGPRSNATVRITDNDKGLQVEFAKYQTREDEGSVLIGVLRGDDGDFPVTVEYATADGTATAGVDYTATAGQLEFAPREKVRLFTIPILKDRLKEASETFRLYLTNATGMVSGRPSAAMITIVDNDPGVQFEFNTYWVQENEGGVTVKVVRGNDVESGAFTVDYATMNLTAIAGQHYTETKGTLAFGVGEPEKLLRIPIIDNPGARADARFKMTLGNATGSATLGVTNTATVTILDTTGMVAHGVEDFRMLPSQGAQLTLSGGVHSRFKDYFDLYPIEVSSSLVDWTPLVTLQQPNSATNTLTCTDPESVKFDKRFYRTVTNHLITPLRKPTGPFAVGVVSRLLTDPSRRNRYFLSTNSSFMASIWYPAVPEAGKLPVRFEDEMLVRDPNWFTTLDGSALFPYRALYAKAYALPNARCAPNGTPCPVVLYSPGWLGDRTSVIVELAEDLASHGYMLVSIDHFDSRGVVFPDGTFLVGDVSVDGLALPGFLDRVRDLQFVMDEMVGWNAADPILTGRMDLTKVAGMGWSWGGGVAGEVCRTDSRMSALVLLDAYLQNADDLVRLGLQKPLLGMYSDGGGDMTLYNKASQDAVNFIISPSTHQYFSSLYWWFYPTDIKGGRETARTIHAYTLWFLNKYLKGSDEPMPTKADYPRVINFKQK